ncbi:MAG: hypothetical protein ABIJ45_07795 [Candidatus Zixiibacteriota bacterium]
MFERSDYTGGMTWTDDSSDFSIELDTGVYRIIYECGHMFPDTFYNFYIFSDTNIDVTLAYMMERHDSLKFAFRYSDASDSLGDSEEYTLLDNLNYFMGFPFDLENARVERYLSSRYSVIYHVKVDSNTYAWQVMLGADFIIHRSSLYQYLTVEPYEFFCMF